MASKPLSTEDFVHDYLNRLKQNKKISKCKRTMEYKDYKVWKIKVQNGVAWVTIDNPPVNLINSLFWEDMVRFFEEVKIDDDVRVIVFQSADPDIFISHYDVGALTDFPEEVGPKPTELQGWKKYFIELSFSHLEIKK